MDALDPILISVLTDILTSLAKSSQPGVYRAVVTVALPTLCNAIATTEEYWVASSAFELLNSVVEGAPNDGLGEGFFATVASPLFAYLARAEDRDVLQVNICRHIFVQPIITVVTERRALPHPHYPQRYQPSTRLP